MSSVMGKAIILSEGTDVTIVTGHLVWEARCRGIRSKGISAEVINIHTIKPLDEEAILKSLAKTKCIVTAETQYPWRSWEKAYQEYWL
jgi:transketolase